MQYLALVQPAHRLQAHVRMRWHLHAGLVGDVVGAVVVDEAPGADHAPAQVGQQSADLGGLAELDVAGAEKFPYGFRHHEAAAAAGTGYGFAIKVAHAAQPRPGGAFASDGPRAVTVAGDGVPARTLARTRGRLPQ